MSFRNQEQLIAIHIQDFRELGFTDEFTIVQKFFEVEYSMQVRINERIFVHFMHMNKMFN